ncbi:putative ascorbate-specific transmembrane electron transporter1 [Zostera marina]|uniref:Putative ascorbate-specific transmembrane electron transporter1 n=1 Tax=Zostera marina TaxID=29655 RepID=A0A0K9PM80_ZOSMR|nr:putative ascorbate-specific transmembrane electron transporter1 [Zostera marina]
MEFTSGFSLPAKLFIYAARVLELATVVMVLVWCIHFRGGLSFKSSDESLIFNTHPVLMLCGTIILGSEAIMSYKSLPFSKKLRSEIWNIWNIFRFMFHSKSGLPNFYSFHSWIGFGTLCLYLIQLIFGVVCFHHPAGKPTFQRTSLPWHVLIGISVYLLSIISAMLGFLEKLTILEDGGLEKYSHEALLVNFVIPVKFREGIGGLEQSGDVRAADLMEVYSAVSRWMVDGKRGSFFRLKFSFLSHNLGPLLLPQCWVLL